MALFVRRHPFLLLGVLTLTLFIDVAALTQSGFADAVAALAPFLRVLVVPMYGIWLLFTMLNVALSRIVDLPGSVAFLTSLCGLVAGLGPYVLADHPLARWRAHDHRVAAT